MNKIVERLPLLLVLIFAVLTGLSFSTRLQAAPASQGTTGLSATDITALLEIHNEWRQRFNVPPLTWDDTVAVTAQDWANQVAATGKFAHRPNNKFGENIWAGTSGFFGPSSVVNSWGSEVADYDFATNTCAQGKVCGHFTQLVWANSTKLGCGKAEGQGNDYYVCNYDPPGNFIGQTTGASPAAPPATAQPIDNPAPTPTVTLTAAPTNAAATAAAVPTNTPNLPPQPTPKSTTNLSAEDATLLLNAHNAWRKKYNVPSLAWDDAVAAAAQVWAEQIATTNSFGRPAGNAFGSNNYFGNATFAVPQDPVDWWGSQETNYNLAPTTCAAGKECRAFTQLVWSATTKVGCGKFLANGNAFFVCNYDPAGNITGQTPGASLTPVAGGTTQGGPTNSSTPTVTRTAIVTPTVGLTATLTVSVTVTVTGTVTVTTTGTITATSLLTTTTTGAGTPTATWTAIPQTVNTLAANATTGLNAADATALLNTHNEWRQRFGVPPLTWNNTVAAVAQDWADEIAATGDFAHRPNNQFGENIWAGSTGFFGPTDSVNSWGAEVADYDFATNTCAAGKECGHFTQLVWSKTTQLGCGKATGQGNDYYVCNYDPPGNIQGETTGASPAPAPVDTQPTATPEVTPQPAASQPTETPLPTVDAPAVDPTNTEPASAIAHDTPNLVIPGSAVLWYTVPYDGTNPEPVIRIPGGASSGLIFQVFSASQIADWPDTTHSGTSNIEGDDLVWRGFAPEVGTYHVVVGNNTIEPVAFSITTE